MITSTICVINLVIYNKIDKINYVVSTYQCATIDRSNAQITNLTLLSTYIIILLHNYFTYLMADF